MIAKQAPSLARPGCSNGRCRQWCEGCGAREISFTRQSCCAVCPTRATTRLNAKRSHYTVTDSYCVSALWAFKFVSLQSTRSLFLVSTVRQRGMGTVTGTSLMGTILRFASVPLRKMGTDLLGSWWPCQCVLPTLTS